jgi:hypothetical protein
MLGALIKPSFILVFIISSVFFFTTVLRLPQQSILGYALVLFFGIFTVPRIFSYFSTFTFLFDFDSASSEGLFISSSEMILGAMEVWLLIYVYLAFAYTYSFLFLFYYSIAFLGSYFCLF